MVHSKLEQLFSSPPVAESIADGDQIHEPTSHEAASPPPPADPAGCRLLNLPPELRNRIWALTVIEPDAIIVTRQRPKRATRAKRMRAYKLPRLTQASTQTRAETLPMFLNENTFRFCPWAPVRVADPSFEVQCFGPLATHIEHTRRIEVETNLWGCVYRLEREGGEEWTQVAVDVVRVSRHAFHVRGESLEVVRKRIEDVLAVSAEGKLERKDFGDLARTMKEWCD